MLEFVWSLTIHQLAWQKTLLHMHDACHACMRCMQAMDGSMSLEVALDERLKIINCTPADVRRFVAKHPPESRLTPVSNEQLPGFRVYDNVLLPSTHLSPA